MRAATVCVLALVLLVVSPAAQTRAGKTLDIYVVDVEGGNATLFVSPSGESLLMDTGNGGAAAVRDADRIMAAVKDAGLTQIDHLITTHWHGDHFGAMAEIARRIPIRHYIDHGPSVQSQPASDVFLKDVYPALVWEGEAHHRETGRSHSHRRPRLAHRHVSGGGDQDAAAGRRQANPLLRRATSLRTSTPPRTRNRSAASITFGRFRAVHLGDLTWNKEFDLMCPTNRIGTADVFFVSHHGQPVSNAEVLVHALQSRVAIMNNGTRKGGQPPAMRIIHSAPRLEDLWQVHFSTLSGQEHTAPGLFIANTDRRSDRRDAGRARSRRRNPAPARHRRRCTTVPRIGSRCRRSRMARSPSPTRATVSARPIAEEAASRAAEQSGDFTLRKRYGGL